jgi:hypothetical protein
MKRLNKEYRLDVSDSVVLKYGSVNKDNPQVVYITGKCWIKPTLKNNYKKIIESAEANMRTDIKNIMADNINFTNKFILDFDVSMDDFLINKKKFVSFDFYLRQNETNKKPLKKLGDVLSRKVSAIANNMVEMLNENGFQVEKRK